jgi:hypothetical protein
VNIALASRILPRRVHAGTVARLKKLPEAKVEIWYRAEDPEAWSFALDIRTALEQSGWVVKEPLALPPSRFNGKDLPIFGAEILDDHHEGFIPFAIASNPRFGSNDIDLDVIAGLIAGGAPNTADLRFAALAIGIGSNMFTRDATLPNNFFRIVIGMRLPE